MQNSLSHHPVWRPCWASAANYVQSFKHDLFQFAMEFVPKFLKKSLNNSTMYEGNMNTTPNCPSPDSLNALNIGNTVAYSIILVASLVGNSLVGIIVYKTKTMRKTINFFIVNMAMSDLLFSLFAFPWALTELNAGSLLIRGIVGHILCKMISFATYVSIAVSIQSLVLIAVNRFGAVVFPLRSPIIGPRLCPFLILATWILAITTQFPLYFVYEFVEYPEKLACEIRWNVLFDESSFYILPIYFIVLSIIELYIPFALITIVYSIILFKLKTQKIVGEQSVNAENLRAKRQRNVLKMAIAIVSVFVICWLPISVLALLSTFGLDHTSLPICAIVWYWFVARIIAHANCAMNPCICFIFSGNYRQGLKSILDTLFSCSIFKFKANFAISS